MKEHCRNDSPHSEGNSKIRERDLEMLIKYHIFPQYSRANWGLAFTHASTSSKCILFAIRSLVQLNYFVKGVWQHDVDWIVSEMIDWLKVSDPAFNNSRNIFNPDNWEEPKSRPSTAG